MSFLKMYSLRGTNTRKEVLFGLVCIVLGCVVVLADKLKSFFLITFVSFILCFEFLLMFYASELVK